MGLVASVGWGLSQKVAGSGEQLFTVVEYIRPGGTCASPNTDNGAFALEGWKLDGTLTYYINANSIPRDVDKNAAVADIQAAANTWDNGTAAALFSLGGITTVKAGKRDGVNAVSFGGAPYGAIAVAYIWAKDGIVQEADMSLSNGFKWAIGSEAASGDCGGADGKMDVQAIATHEFGHWLGAAHTSDDTANNAQTMFPFASYKELFKQSLASGDKTALNSLYGP